MTHNEFRDLRKTLASDFLKGRLIKKQWDEIEATVNIESFNFDGIKLNGREKRYLNDNFQYADKDNEHEICIYTFSPYMSDAITIGKFNMKIELDKYYSGYAVNKKRMMILTWAEHDNYLYIARDKNSFDIELAKVQRFYKEVC